MHFTQEDYKKIENWLLRNSVKDSEFQEALPIKGNEKIVIIQNGFNRVMSIRDFINEVINLGVSDFINVSNDYNSYGIDLQNAVALIPSKFRKKGLVITFYDIENNWKIYQFTGVINQWNNLTLWNDITSYKKEEEPEIPDEPSEPEQPEEPSEPEVLTYEFNIPMTKQEEEGITYYDGQITKQDYSELFDKILEIARTYGDSGDGWCSLYDEETVKKYTNITVNGFRATNISWYESSNSIDIGTDGPDNGLAMSMLNLTKTYVYFSSPVPKKEEPSDVIEYHFEFNNLEEEEVPGMGMIYGQSIFGDYTEPFNRILSFTKDKGTENGGLWEYGEYGGEPLTDIVVTANGYKAVWINAAEDSIQIVTNGPQDAVETNLYITPTYVMYESPTNQKAPSSDIIEYHFEFNNLEEEDDGVGNNGFIESQDGDFSEIFNKVYQLVESKGSNNQLTGDVVTQYTNITINGYRVDEIIVWGDNNMELNSTNGPTNGGYLTGVTLSKTNAWYQCPSNEKGPEAPKPEPDTPSEPEVLTYEFNIPMVEDYDSLYGETYYSGVINAEFGDIYNKIDALAKAFGEDLGYQWYLDNDKTLEKTNISVNGYRITYIESNTDGRIVLGIGGVFVLGGDAQAWMSTTSIQVDLPQPWNPNAPKPEPDAPSEPEDGGILTYAFNIPNMEEEREFMDVYYVGTLEGDFSGISNDIKTLVKSLTNKDGNGWYLSYEDTMKHTNITINGYRVEYIECYDNSITLGSYEQVAGGDSQAYLTNISIEASLPQPWNPNAPKPESDIIEYHFEIPMEEDGLFIEPAYYGTLEGDFSKEYSAIVALSEKIGVFKNGFYTITEGGSPLTNPKITVNGFNVTEIRSAPSYERIEFSTDAPYNGSSSGDGTITKTAIDFSAAEPHAPSSDLIEYHFEIPMEEQSEFGIEIQLYGELEGDYSETFERLKSYLITNGERVGDSLGVGVRFSEIPLENPKITINNLFVTDLYMPYENSLEIELGTNGGSDMSCDSTAFLTRTSISIMTPKQ